MIMEPETIWISGGLVTAIIAMALYIKSLHKHSTTKLTDVLLKNSDSNNHLAEAIDNMSDSITNKILVALNKAKK